MLVLLVIGIVVGFYLTRRFSREWSYWQELPASVKQSAVELEVERVWHRVFSPRPVPTRYDHVTAASLDQSMRYGADWLLRMQEPSGRFQYWYRPDQDRFSPEFNDNFLRQAGTAFSLTAVYEMTGKPQYMDAAQKNLQYQLGFIEMLDSDKAYFLFQKKAKLGGIALPMLSMLKLRELTGTTEYDAHLLRLSNMILFLQEKYGTGQYKSTYVYRGDYEYEKNKGWESRIYPGEAMLALASMYRAFDDERYRKSVDWALDFYSRKRRWRNHAFLAWTIAAFTSLYEDTREAQYADFAFRLSDFLLTQQNLDPDDEVYGSFHGLPTANTGSYMEGLGDAIHLARLTGDTGKLAGYQEYAKMGYRWLCQLQYTPDLAEGLAQPEWALGGIRTSLWNSELRIDNTQHAISSFAKGLRYVFQQHPGLSPGHSRGGNPSTQAR